MAVLLVSLSVMAVLLTVAMPVWKQNAQREKEAELVFRGMQYARAVNLFQRKHGPGTLPPSIDVLVEEHELRKKYKDPITNGDFQPLLQGRGTPPGTGSPAAGGLGRGRGAQPQPPAPPVNPSGQRGAGSGFGPAAGRGAGAAAGPAVGGILGVQSKSTDQSIRIYNGRTHYNEWAFVYQPPLGAPGTGSLLPGRLGGPGQRGGPPFGPTGRGRGFQPSAPPGGRGFRGNPPPAPGGGRQSGPGGGRQSGQPQQPLRRPGT